MTVARFWREQENRYNLIGVKCGNCGKIYFPPKDMCTDCHRLSLGKMTGHKISGTGKVVTYSIVHEGPEAFKMQIPYIMAIIELDEGTRITGQIVDCEPEDVKIDMPVHTVFRKIHEEGKSGVIHYGYKFRPTIPIKSESKKED
ncbi:MAG: Zn-ribbon domain-containing OB-fold protein [Thermoplasmata archaeon]|nr:MAG: Zn-ribbon domain-containing OB-fold protein [Thermoplasmata archaeon]